ncbi:MAG: hypothetical protein MUC50_14335 [Myxococcota bacterium]|nr:hypothetical protein [Myxococcota bacterium]
MGAALLLLSYPRPSAALDPHKHMRQYVQTAWSVEQGLVQVTVQDLAQSADGYLWVGTQDGLARFDGVRFTTFDKSNTPAMKANDVKALFIDSARVLWVGLNGGGLVRYDGREFRHYGVEDGLVDDKVFFIAEAPAQKELLVGTVGGLSVLRDEKFTSYTVKQGLPFDVVNSILIDSKKRVWLATGKGLGRYENGKVRPATEIPEAANKGLESLYEDRKGRLWLGTWGDGILRWDGQRITSFAKEQGVTNLIISDFAEDRDGNLFVATFGGGLLRLEGEKFTALTEADGLSKDILISVLEDREGNLWLGTEMAGLFQLRDGKFTTYSTADGLLEPSVRTIFEDKSSALWLGLGAKGISRFRDGRFENFGPKDGVPDSGIRGLIEDRQGTLWIGTYNEGVLQYKDGLFSKPEALANMPLGGVRSIEEDRAGNLWFAIYGKGLLELRQTQEGLVTRQITEQDGLASNQVLVVKEDSQGALWIGAWGKGITRYKDGAFKVFTVKDGLGHDVVLSFYEDEAANYWFGTYGGGLALLRGGVFTNITKRDGLFEDVVYVILPDDAGNLWMSCNKGVFRVSRRQLLDFADGKISRVDSVSYDQADGMRQHDCNGGSSPAGTRDKTGRLWFPTVDGITSIDPANIKLNKTPPPLLLEQLLVNGEPMPVTADLRIEPGAETIEFHYTSTSFISPEKIIFDYRLEGFDSGFVEADRRRVAYYTNLNPGEYRFLVKARNADGVWSKETVLASFELLPAFYQTLWFQLLCLAAFAGLIFAIARIRLEQVKRQNVILEQKVKERTAELEEAHKRIVQLEKETTEKQMAGGFAHEMRNSLAGAKMLVGKLLCINATAGQPQSQFAYNSQRLLELFKLAKAEMPAGSAQKVAAIVKEVHESEKRMDLLTNKAFQSIERSLDVTTLIMDYAKVGGSALDMRSTARRVTSIRCFPT